MGNAITLPAAGVLAAALLAGRRIFSNPSQDALRKRINSDKYKLPHGFEPSYGTAGFRARGDLLASTMFRSGIIAAARARATGKVTGICITASHNPEEDNGVKISEPGGEMLLMAWEEHANRLANVRKTSHLWGVVTEILEAEGVPLDGPPGVVYLAMDTRPTGPKLLQAAREGVEALGCTAVDLGMLTTPQLHFAVRATNSGGSKDEAFYFNTLAGGFKTLVEGKRGDGSKLIVDCANGVGALKIDKLVKRVAGTGLQLDLRNTDCGTLGVLNHECGADYVQKERKLPAGITAADAGTRCVSLDGDADRLVYFEVGQDGGLHLLDGDKIAALVAVFVKDAMAHLPASIMMRPPGAKVGVVQTAYANGASTKFISQTLGLSTGCTPTGVKFLHEEACAEVQGVGHKLDIGIYFEANGHGTALFSPHLLGQLRVAASGPAPNESAIALLALSEVINQAVGDALSGVLMVEAILRVKGWGLVEWMRLYTDLPSRQLKVTVADRSVIQTTDAERRAAAPAGLQALVDAEVAKVASGRAFVRPSGTEDVVRVYAEAATQEAADALARAVAGHVHARCGGVGPSP